MAGGPGAPGGRGGTNNLESRGLSEMNSWVFEGALNVFYLRSACELFRQIVWDIHDDTTYNFFYPGLEGLGFRV